MSEEVEAVVGRYLGELIWKPLPDGRIMELVSSFGFLDERQKRWPVPAGARVDGASIPQVLWSIMGGPFEGKYRDASVIHDYYCDTRLRPWRSVHRVFYNAMRVSGVSASRAKLMYAAVLYGGPRWSDVASRNANLPRPDDYTVLFSQSHSAFENGVVRAVVKNEGGPAPTPETTGYVEQTIGDGTNVLDLSQMDGLIDDYNPSISEIEKAIDLATFIRS